MVSTLFHCFRGFPLKIKLELAQVRKQPLEIVRIIEVLGMTLNCNRW